MQDALQDSDWDSFIDASCAMLRLTISDDSKPVVRMNLEIAARMARLLDDVALDDREEPAPVFEP